MTTVFGIKHPSVESTILVADRQTTFGDSAGIPKGKMLYRKLWTSKDKNFCFGHSGQRDKELEDFIQAFREGKYNIEKITNTGYFPELRKLNLKRMGKKLPNPNLLSGLLLATRLENKPKLYTCFPLGQVEQRDWSAIGSGDEKVFEYMDALGILAQARDYEKKNGVGMKDIIQVGLEAVRRAQSQDVYSHGLDMLVCGPKKIKDHYAELGDDFINKLKRIQRQYKK